MSADAMLSDAPQAPRKADILTPTPGLGRRKFWDRTFIFWGILATVVGLLVLSLLVWQLVRDGAGRLTLDFFLSFPSRDADQAGILSAWVGSLLVITTTALIAIPLGVMAGIYLEEYAPKNPITDFIEITVNNLAGVPSIIYGLLALGLFVYAFGLGQSILTAGLTLALLILPIIIVATREAIRGVPQGIRDAALALGASKWQTTSHHVLPYSTPGILTGAIIGLSRALGETAPLITIGALTFIAFLPIRTPGEPQFIEIGQYDSMGMLTNPDHVEKLRVPSGGTMFTPDGETVTIKPGETVTVPAGTSIETNYTVLGAAETWLPWNWLMEAYTVMPIQMFNWTSRPEDAFRNNAAAAGLVLLAITLLMNGTAIYMRYRLRKNIKW